MSDYTIKPEQELPEKATIAGSDEVRIVGGTTRTSYLAKASSLASYFVSYLEGVTSWRLKIYPVGSIYMSVNNVNPGTLFGGTWVAWGTGRVPVGIDTSDSSFNTVEKTGGSKNSIIPYHNHGFTGTQLATHTHTGPSHSHSGGTLTGINVNAGYEEVLKTSAGNKVSALTSVLVGAKGYNNTGSSGTGNTSAVSAGTPSGTVGYAGTSGNTTNANLQPYITCYMWKRTA